MAQATNDQKVAAALARLQSGGRAGSSKRDARVQATLAKLQRRGSLPLSRPVASSGNMPDIAAINKELASRYGENPAPPNNSSWAKGLGLVGKALEIIDTPGSYVRSNIDAIARGIETGDVSNIASGLSMFVPGLNQLVNAADNFGGDPNAPKGFLSKFMFADKQQEKGFWANKGTGEYLQGLVDRNGGQGTFWDNPWLKRGIGIVGDIGTDPLTWASGGAKAVVGTTAKGAVEVAGKELVEQGTKQLAKEGAEQAGKKIVQFSADGITSTVKTLSDDAARATADDAIRNGGKAAANAVAGAEDAVEIAGKVKSRLVQGYKGMSDLFFERARALGVDDPMRAQLEQIGASIRRARSTWVASNDELALVGAKRGIWLPGKRVIGSDSKVLESALRAREAVGGGARRLISDPAANLLEGTFGKEEQNALRKAARSGKGPEAARAVLDLQAEQFSRHRANGMMIDLARGIGRAIDTAEKNGVDANEMWRAVQDEAAFQEIAARSPKAAEGVQGLRDELRKARTMFKDATGEELPDNPYYVPRRFTAEATEFINEKPEYLSERAGPASFTQGRTLRSGQDNPLREVDRESSVFLGEAVPRNLTDAQVTDWANARYKYVFGEDAPQLFETDIRKLMSSYLDEFKGQVHKDLYTRQLLRAGYGSDVARQADEMLQGTNEDVSARLRGVADQLVAGMEGHRAGTLASLDGIGAALRDIDAIAKVEAKTGRTWTSLRKTLLKAKADLKNGNIDRAVARLRNEAERNIAAARRSEGKLARISQQRAEKLERLIAKLEQTRDEAYQRTVDVWDQPRAVADEARVARAGENAARITERQWMPTYADKQAAEQAGQRGRGYLAPDTRRQVAADAEQEVYGDARRVASENAAADAARKSADRQLLPQQQDIYSAEWRLAEAERDLANANREVSRELADWVGDNPKAQAALHDMMQQTIAGQSILDRIDAGEAVETIIADKINDIENLARLMGINPSQVVPLKSSLEEIARKYAAAAAKNASGAPNALDKMLLDVGIGDAQAKGLIRFLFGKKSRKEAVLDVELKSGRGSLRNSKEFAGARKPVRAELGALQKLRRLDESGQFETMLRNMYARTVSVEGFDSLPPEAQALFNRAEENILKKGNLKNALHVYDRLNNVVKGWLLAKPGFVFRNIIGGLFMNMVDGVSLESHVRMFRAFKADVLRQKGMPGAWNKLNKRDKWMYERVREFMSQADTLAATTSQGTARPSVAGRLSPVSPNFFWVAGNRKFNEVAEDIVLRGSMAFDTLNRDPALIAALRAGDQRALDRALAEASSRAITRVNTFHFSYDKADKSVFENEVLARMMPFYTYTRNAIPLMVSMMIERPKYFAWANSVARNLQLGVPEEGVLPEYIRESGAIRTPFSFGGNRVYWMQDLPLNQLIDSSQDPVNFVASAFTPLLKTPVELAQGQQFYKQIPITQDMKESKFANVPALSQALTALGAQRTGANGQQFMRDDLQYALGQFVPPAYQLGGYMPATETQQLKWPTRVVSDATGIRLRVNTPEDQKNELARRNIKEREKKAKKTREANRGYGNPADKSKKK